MLKWQTAFLGTDLQIFFQDRGGRELKQSKQKRERLYQKYRRNKTVQNLLARKRARAQHKYNTKQNKIKGWREFVSKLNKNTPVTKVYEAIKKIKGREQKKKYFETRRQTLFNGRRDM